MLVLTRKCQEKIQIGENITITIVRVKGQSVRVGIEAPREMKVLRTELPPESSAANGVSSEVDLTARAPARSTSGLQSRPLGRPQSADSAASDRRPQAAAAPQPLAQYVPAVRMAAVTCGG